MSPRATSRWAPLAPGPQRLLGRRAWAASHALAMVFSLLTPAQVALAQSTAQPLASTPGTPTCTAPADLVPAQLYGRWQLNTWPQSVPTPAPRVSSGTITFERHPEFPDSVRGRLQRQANDQAIEALVSGDVISGEFNLDESADGQRIDAVWTGDVTPAGCGREIRGVRLPAQDQAGEPMNFVLTKVPGWD